MLDYFFIKVAGLQYLFKKLQAFWLAILLKRDSNTGVLLKFVKFLRTPILKNIHKDLLLNVVGLK